MKKEPLIIDTDPGIDDAAALAIALFSGKLDVRLITTVAGNVSIKKVTANALKLLAFWDKKIPIAQGAEQPLVAPLIDASAIHGISGMDGFDFPPPNKSSLLKDHAVNQMRRILAESEEPITLVALGPLTNIALLFSLYPKIKTKVKRIVLMGGSITRGNKGVMSEFNFATDPEAAKIVFNSKLPLVMVGLDIGWKALIIPEDTAKLLRMGKTGKMLYALFQRYRSTAFESGLGMYDSCAIAYILKPDMFKTADVFVDIELAGAATRGCSLVDLHGYLKQKPNAKVCTDIDAQQFRLWFIDSLSQCT